MRLVGLGQAYAGDDGVGPLIAREAREVVPGLEVVELTGAEGLIDLLDGRPTMVVDAVVDAGPPGALLDLLPGDLGRVRAFSTHGIGVAEALALAEALNGPEVLRGLRLLGVTIHPPSGWAPGLSAEVADAVPRALDRVRRWSADVRRARGLA